MGAQHLGVSGAPGETRTPDLLVRSQSLYPAELRARRIHRIITLAPSAAPGTITKPPMDAARTYIENEIKLRFPGSAEAASALIESLGYRMSERRTLESDQLFDRGEQELLRAGQLLRLRRMGDTALITFKGPSRKERHKSREEIEFGVSDAGAVEKVLERLGYAPGFRYEKYRTTFSAAGEPGFVTVDETPMGVFLELEGPPVWVDQTAARLGFLASAYLTSSYASLYREYRHSHPGAPEHMTFLDSGTPRTDGKHP
jgi:adenylate cyclase class 2